MENKVFEANLALIDEYNQKLVNKIRNLKSYSQTFELSKTSQDEYNLKVNGIDIHSNIGAIDEAKKIVEGIANLKEKNSAVVIFGLGLGYLFDEVVQNSSGNVILFEPNLEILKCTLEIVDMTELLTRKNVKICSEIEDLKIYIEEFSDKLTKISISFLTSYYKVYEKQIQEVAQIVEYSHGENAALDNTIMKLGIAALNNTFINLRSLLDAHFIKEFSAKFKMGSTPALIVSAGPSLAENIEIIKQNQNKFIIFCVGPALKLLLKNNIKPDFVVIVETKNTIGQIENLDLSDINLIVEPYTYHGIWSYKTKNKIVFFSKFNFLNDFLASALKINNENLHSFGTVSHCALSSAELMGCNPIVLIGQDLAYTDGKCYAKGSVYENLECKFNEKTNKFEITVPESNREHYIKALLGEKRSKLDDVEIEFQKYLEFLNDNLYTVDGQNGEKLPTQTGYALFIKHFEDFAEQNSKLFGRHNRLINSSTGGAQINGFENIPLCDVVKSLQNINIDKSFNFEEKKTNYNKENLVKILISCVSDFQETAVIAGEIKELFDKISKEYKTRKTVTKNIEKLLGKAFEKINRFEKSYFEKNPAVYFYYYSTYKPISTIMNKNKADFSKLMTAYDELLKKIELFNKVAPYALNYIEYALEKCSDE